MELYITSVVFNSKENITYNASDLNNICTSLSDAIRCGRDTLADFIEAFFEDEYEDILNDSKYLDEVCDYTIEIHAFNTEKVDGCVNKDHRTLNIAGNNIVSKKYSETNSLLQSFLMVDDVNIEIRYKSNIAYCNWNLLSQFDYHIMMDDCYNEISPFIYKYNIGDIVQYNDCVMKIIDIPKYDLSNMMNYDLGHSMMHTYMMIGVNKYGYINIIGYDNLIHDNDIKKDIDEEYKYLIPFVESMNESYDEDLINTVFNYWLATEKIDYTLPVSKLV